MPEPDLSTLVAPAHTALVTVELQNGVVGERSVLPELAAVARREAVSNGARLAKAARAAGVAVVHCLAARRADGRGSNANARLFLAARKSPVPLRPGSEEAALVPEIGLEDSDIVLTRLHGLGPMGGTDLDPVLRNLGVETIVTTGVSLNVAIINLTMDAVNAGYRVVVPRDAVAGVPEEYARAVLANTLSYIATVTTTGELLAAWGS